ncbi:krev interaction trapped protein 1-like [Ciona intestinalis]
MLYIAIVRPAQSITPKHSIKSLKSTKDVELFIQEAPSIGTNDSDERKRLPSVGPRLSYHASKQAIIDHVFQVTKSASPSNTGIKAKRVIHAKDLKLQVNGTPENVTLYVVPTLIRGPTTPYPFQASSEPNAPCGFHTLHQVTHEVNGQGDKYNEDVKPLVDALERWMKRQMSRPTSLQALFRPTALDRIHENITNPAYAAEPNRDWLLLENKLTPEQAMTKMKETNKTDHVVHNPLYGIHVYLYNKVDMLVTNPYYGQAIPDYSKIKIPDREQWFKGEDNKEESRELSWVEEFPLHRAAADGDLPTLRYLLRVEGSKVDVRDHDGWPAIHYACWYGRVDAVKILLDEGGCDPNITNRNETSLLHLAAGCGCHNIIRILVDHPFIDRHLLDKQQRTPIECAEQIKSKDWNKCVQLLKELSHKPYKRITVHKMDGSEKTLDLRKGSNATVNDLIESLRLSNESKLYFSLWVTSKSLHLQLKPDHSPLTQMQKWPELLCQLSGVRKQSAETENPRLVLKRDVNLLPNVEEEVSDIYSTRLLYEEARAQVLRGLYPSLDQVAIAMAAVVMRIIHGPYDHKKHKPSFMDDTILRQILPGCKLHNRTLNWPQKILQEFKELSEQGPGEASQLHLLYLRYCWTQISTYGSAFFTGYAYATRKHGNDTHQRIVAMYIGVNHRGIHFIKVENKALLVSVSYLSLSWKLNEAERLFQIRTGDDKINMIIHTPQAELICHLMSKLSQAAC